MNTIKYENRYGTLEIEVVGPFQQVSEIRSLEVHHDCFFGLDDSEKIALITGNDGIQLCFPLIEGRRAKAYLIHHESRSVAAVCRVVRLSFDAEVNATEVLARPTSCERYY